MTSSTVTIRGAYTECRRLARRHYENFPVASYLIPRDRRDALAAIYAFARCADDVADEPGIEQRLEKLANWRAKLRDCYDGRGEHPVFIALHDAAASFRLSERHFHDLLTAFEQDVRQNRHTDFNSLLAYCRFSANPVGRLVLELFDHRDAELIELSDHVCTALQLANFWQDVAVDLARDRVYLPTTEFARFDLSVEDLRGFASSQEPVRDGRWRELMAFQVARTREIFEQGRALPEKVRRELRRQLRLTWLGGMAILDGIERAGYDVFHHRPALGLADFLRLYLRARRGPLAAHPLVQTSERVVTAR